MRAHTRVRRRSLTASQSYRQTKNTLKLQPNLILNTFSINFYSLLRHSYVSTFYSPNFTFYMRDSQYVSVSLCVRKSVNWTINIWWSFLVCVFENFAKLCLFSFFFSVHLGNRSSKYKHVEHVRVSLYTRDYIKARKWNENIEDFFLSSDLRSNILTQMGRDVVHEIYHGETTLPGLLLDLVIIA